MHRSSIALSFAAFTLLAGCRTHYSQYYLGSDDYVLASRDGPGDRKESYRLEVRGDNCSLRVATEYERERPFLGLKLTELDKGQAERRGVTCPQSPMLKNTAGAAVVLSLLIRSSARRNRPVAA